MWNIRLYGGEQGPVRSDETVGHAGSVKGEAGIAVAVEEDEASGGVGSFAKKMNGFAGGEIGGREIAGRGGGSGNTNLGAAKKIDNGFCQYDFHYVLPVAGAGDASGLRIRPNATAAE